MTVDWTLVEVKGYLRSIPCYPFLYETLHCILARYHRVGELLENFFSFPRPSPVLDLAFEAQAFALPGDATF